MFKSVQALLEKLTATCQPSNAFSASFENFKTKNEAIDLLCKKTESGSKKATIQKKYIREKLIEQTFGVTVMMMDCLSKFDDKELYYKVKCTKDDLQQLPCTQLIAHAKAVLALAHEKQEILADYRLSKAVMNELGTTIGLYEHKLDILQLTSVELSAAHNNLDKLFREANHILTHELDQMIVAFEKSHPEFFNEYLSIRKVVECSSWNNTETRDPHSPSAAGAIE